MATIVALSSFSVAGAQAPRAGQRRSPVGVSPRRHALVVRCHSEPEMQPPEDTAPTTPSAPASASDPSAPQPSPAPKKPQTTKVSTKFWDVLAFRGPAPERINGRLAMVGFVSALAVEAARGDGLLEQVGNGGAAWFVGTAAVLSVASLVPLLRGESVQDRSEGLMNAEAELWNGRFAMLGLVALAFTEFLKGGPLV